MESTHEFIAYKNESFVNIHCIIADQTDMHWHQSLEIIYILDGQLNLNIEGTFHCLREHELAVVNSGELHSTSSQSCVLLLIQFNASLLGNNSIRGRSPRFDCISDTLTKNKDISKLQQIIAKLAYNSISPQGQDDFLNYTYANELLQELFLHFRPLSSPQDKTHNRTLEHFQNISNYIESHLTENISLSSIARNTFLSYSYVSHFFPKYMGTTFSRYLAQKRAAYSIWNLLNTNSSLEQIALSSGFANVRTYNSAFKNVYGMLPSQYRKHYKSAENLSKKEFYEIEKLTAQNYFKKIEQFLPEGFSKNKFLTLQPLETFNLGNIPVTLPSSALLHTWRTFCAVGRAKELLYGHIQDMLRIQQKEIGYQYIKFHGIFDDALKVYSEDSNGLPCYNFVYTDQIFDFLLSIGLKPLVEFSFMPKALAKDKSKSLFYFPFYISEPSDDQKWYNLVHSFIQHYINRYGLHQLNTWFFAFWSETLYTTPFQSSNLQRSFELYELTYHAVKDCSKSLKFAGLSFIPSDASIALYQKFLVYCHKAHCEPDIFIMNYFPITEGLRNIFITSDNLEYEKLISQSNAQLDIDPDTLHNVIKKMKNLLPLNDSRPIYLLEWNLTTSHREWLNDTCFSACYIIKNILENYDALASYCHWSLTDWIEENNFSTPLFHGGMGLFTRNGIKKPAYYAYYFLSKLQDQLVKNGEGYFITKGLNTYTIIFYNYVHFSELYAQGNKNNSEVSTFNRGHFLPSRCYNMQLTDLSNGVYTLTEQYINQDSGNPLNVWKRMGAHPHFTDTETERIKCLSVPEMYKKDVLVTDHKITLKYELKLNEIRLIELQRTGL